jgi:hypothetical protein
VFYQRENNMTAVLVLKYYVEGAHITIKTSLLDHQEQDIKMIKIQRYTGDNRWCTSHRKKNMGVYCSLCLKWR